MTKWTYKGEEVDSIDEQYYGFVYRITNILSGKQYIGKKIAKFKRKLPPLKGKKRKRIKYVDSDWQTYWGSSEYLKADIDEIGINNFKREIVSFHSSKSSWSFGEVDLQFKEDVLYSLLDNGEKKYYNGNISGKYYYRPEYIEDRENSLWTEKAKH